MPRKLTSRLTVDTFEDEVLFTIASMKADPDAVALIGITDDWLQRVDEVRRVEREARLAIAETDAKRMISNNRLDSSCTDFANELLFELKRDTNSVRWKQFFRVSVSKFVRIGLSKQTMAVRAWLNTSQDPVLMKHKDSLNHWVSRCENALQETAGVALVRAKAWSAREQLAEELTVERDSLRDALAEVGRTKKLSREWPEIFFRTQRSRSGGADPVEPEEPEEPQD